jgi:hypothetical protein
MKIQISFNYHGFNYYYTVDDEKKDMIDQDDKTWSVVVFHNDGWFNPLENYGLLFKIIADKRFIDGKEIISGDNIKILVYDKYGALEPIDTINNGDGKTIEIQYA